MNDLSTALYIFSVCICIGMLIGCYFYIGYQDRLISFISREYEMLSSNINNVKKSMAENHSEAISIYKKRYEQLLNKQQRRDHHGRYIKMEKTDA